MTAVLQELPWYWEVALHIQSIVDTTGERYLATVLAIGVFLLSVAVMLVVGKLLSQRHSEDTVQAVQSLTVTAVSIVLGGFLVAVWRLTSQVADAVGFLVFGPEAAVKVLVTFIVFAAAYTVTRLTKRSIKYGVVRDTITPHQREVAHHLVQIAILIPVVLFTLELWSVDPTNILLGAGFLGVILGFAARQTLSGALSGFVILFTRPFEVGDWIRVDDREGIVTDVTLYNTQIRTFDEEHVLMPNDSMTGNEVINYSKTRRLRLTTDVSVDYDVDVAAAARIATDAMSECEEVATTPNPDVIRHRFGDSAVVLRLRYWIDEPAIERKWRAQNQVVEAVKGAFEEEGIKIPYPQRELVGREETGGFQVAAETPPVADGQEDGEPTRAATTDVEEPVAEEHGDDSDGETATADED